MGELKREIELIKEQCKYDPAARANWTGILIMLVICLLLALLMLPFILSAHF